MVEAIEPIPPVAGGAPASPPLENDAPPIAGGDVPGGDDAAALAASHGGDATQSAADRKKLRDKVRAWERRNPGQVHPERHLLDAAPRRVARRSDPPPIPASLPPTLPPAAAAAATADSAPPFALDGADGADVAALLDWTPEEVAEITDDLIDWADDEDRLSDVKAARLAKLSEALVKTIEADAGLPKITKRFLQKYLPRYTAQKLNEMKLNPKTKNESALFVAGIVYLWDKWQRRRFIAAEAKRQGTAPVTDQAKP